MKISTVTVCFNSQSSIARTIESFLAQNHVDKELVIVDGGSRDRTLDIARGYGDPAIRIQSEPDKGIYDAMNKGLRLYAGDAVGFLNSDDAYHDDKVLARIAQALESADAVYGDLVMVADHRSRRPVRNWKAGGFVRGAFRKGWMPPHPTFYVRRELAERVGRFDDSYRISADYDFMLRALELQDARVQYIPHTLIDFLVGGMSTQGVGAVVRGNLECLKARRRHLGAPPVDAALFAKPLRKLRQLVWRDKA